MLLSWPLSLPQTLLSITCLSISYYTYHYLTTIAPRRRFIATKGCKPIRKWRNKDPFLGLDFLWAMYKALRDHRGLEMMKERFDILGVNTAHIMILTRTFVATVEPENVKCVLAGDFRSYSLATDRKMLLRPFLGEGIFTTDGKEWVFFFFFSSRMRLQ